MLWISTPNDWHVRTSTTKTTAHWQRIQHWIKKAVLLGVILVVYGPPGFLWNIPDLKETIQDMQMNVSKIRLCHFGDKFDSKDPKPSGSYLQVATTSKIPLLQWQCNCKIPIKDHVLDWYGRHQEQSDWRRKISSKYVKEVCTVLGVKPTVKVHAITDSVTPPSPISVLPTDARVRQKARLKAMKEAGLKPKKVQKPTEAGNDDCGDDISGLGKDAVLLMYDVTFEDIDSSSDEDLFIAVPQQVMRGNMHPTEIFSAVSQLCYGYNSQVDMLELCGNEGRISQVAFRRGLTSGGNLDLVSGCDLGDPTTQKAINHYLDTCYVMVVILQPNCRSVGSFAAYNEMMYHDTWSRHHKEDLPHLQYCGEVALKQMQKGRFFLREQPAGTRLDYINPWPKVLAHGSVITQLMDQCMTGKKDDAGMPVQKTTEWTANSPHLLWPMQRLACDRSHTHGHPTGKALEKTKVYTWMLCNTIVTGVQDLKTYLGDAWKHAPIYPTIGTGSDDIPPPLPRAPPGGAGCPACHNRLRNDSPLHTRDPTSCRHPNIKSKKWECPACEEVKGRSPLAKDPGHTFVKDQCKFADRGAPPRSGAHPRDPRRKATTHPSAEASSVDAIAEAADTSVAGEPAPSTAADTSVAGKPAPSASSTGPHEDPASIDYTKGPTSVRGPDGYQRVRRTYTDAGTGPTRLPDWTRFNIQVSLKSLRSYNPAVVQKELRKLHLRWWHAKEPKMRLILSTAGIDEVRLAMIKPIVDTCRECRAWEKRGNVIVPSTDITLKFNEKGETDLMFYKRKIVFHIIDRAIRLSDGCEMPNKEAVSLLNAYATTWVQRHGPFQILYTDGELGFNNEKSIAELNRLGTELRVRAPDQHARIAEARQSMLRHVMHMIEAELDRHGQEIPFSRLLAEALFVVNAFSFYNGVSPYNALTGRQPACLPDLENIDFPTGGEKSDHLREQRIREAGIGAITQSTSIAKVKRASTSATTPDGSHLYHPGDLMDYHRPTATKDEHGGWNGPHVVVRNLPERGLVVCNVGNKEVNVRYPDARPTLFLEAVFTMELGMDNDAMDTIINYISRLTAGKLPETFGYVVKPGERGNVNPGQLTTVSKKAPKVLLALQYVIRNFFRIPDVFAVRLGKSVKSVGKCDYAERCTLVYYMNDGNPNLHYYETKDTALDIKYITQCDNARIIQCLMKSGCHSILDENAQIIQELAPTPATPQEMHGNAHPEPRSAGPPTPQSFDIGGELQPIDEGDDEEAADELITEAFWAELENNEPLQPDPLYNDTEQPMPQKMMPESTILFMARGELDSEMHGNTHLEPTEVYVKDTDDVAEGPIESDEIGQYVELCFTDDMAPVVLGEHQHLQEGEVATMRVYISADQKRTVVVKEDDLLSKKELEQNAKEVADATISEIKTWIGYKCFKKCFLKDARNVMTSRYVAKWKWVLQPDGKWLRLIRMRMCLRGFMDLEAFSLDTFSGTAKRSSQRILASEAACHSDWIIASLDIDKAFLQGFTYKELAEATGEKERKVCFRLPPGSAAYLRKFPGFEDFDESIHCLESIKPGTGTKDAPRAFSLKLRKTTQAVGLRSTSFDPEFEVKKDLLSAKHVDDVNTAGVEKIVDHYFAEVEKVFGKCKVHKKQYTNCGVQSTMLDSHDVTMDQDAYISTLRPIVHVELTGATAEHEATKNVADLFVSLRGALAYTTLTQAWIQVYIVALQRVQKPTNLDCRRLNAITRKLQKEPKKLIFASMQCQGHCDLHTDSGYRRIEAVDDVKGYGMRGLTLLRRGIKPNKESVVHLIDSVCKSHRLTIRSSYGAEMLAASHGYDDAFPTLVTLVELKNGVLRPEELKKYREEGGLALKVFLTTDAESVFKSLTSRDLKTPAEKTLLGHVCWIRELLQLQLIESIQWCDTRDMTADGHTKGCIERELLLELMEGRQTYKHEVKTYTPHRSNDKNSAAWKHAPVDETG